MRAGAVLLLAAASMWGQDGQTPSAQIDEAFQLAGVRTMLSALPQHVNEMTAAALGQLPSEKRLEFGPLIHDVSVKFLNPDAFSRQLRTYFARHYDGKKMAMFLALERTPAYRSMHRVEAEAEAANAMTRHRFETNLKGDPPPPGRVKILQRLDRHSEPFSR